MRRSLRLSLFAVVLLGLIGGTLAFFVAQKTVVLTVDGQAERVGTYADTVAEVLAEEGLEPASHDVLLPAADQALADFAAREGMTLDSGTAPQAALTLSRAASLNALANGAFQVPPSSTRCLKRPARLGLRATCHAPIDLREGPDHPSVMSADPKKAPFPPNPIIEHYKQFVDRSLIRENLKLTVEERLRKLESMLRFLQEWRGAASKSVPRL